MLTLPECLHPFATLFRPDLAESPNPAGRRDTGPGPTHRGCGATRHGTQRAATTLAIGAQSGGVVAPSGGWHPARAARIWTRAVDLRHRRDPGAASRPYKSLGIYRDAVRSSRSQVVKASGLRWIPCWLGPPGRDAIGPCPERRPRHATTGSADAAIKNSPTGRQMILQPRSW